MIACWINGAYWVTKLNSFIYKGNLVRYLAGYRKAIGWACRQTVYHTLRMGIFRVRFPAGPPDMNIYNSLTRKKEKFMPVGSAGVGVYTCGPTVYDYVTIGNWRTYILGDLLVRTLGYQGYSVDYIMNITDVGHLTGDNLGDASTGEDRMEKASEREGKNAWKIAEFYSSDFKRGYKKLNLVEPKSFCEATKHIKVQIELIKAIEKNGYTYRIDDGIYFDVQKYSQNGYKYGKLSTLDKIKPGARVELNLRKKDPRDFALWKFTVPGSGPRRQMEWYFDGPLSGNLADSKSLEELKKRGHVEDNWVATIGFPGWHIECSAMSLKYLGNAFHGRQFHAEQSRTIDIHIGGEDLKSTHHPNEIAQSEAATGKHPFVKYWMHGAFLLADGGRMGKSLGNAYNLHDLDEKGYDAMVLRYFYLTAHYRRPQNFTWMALDGAQNAWEKLKNKLEELKSEDSKFSDPGDNPPAGGATPEMLAIGDKYQQAFDNYLNNDLDMPGVLSVLWSMLKDKKLTNKARYELFSRWNMVLGFVFPKIGKTPSAVSKLAEEREKYKEKKNYSKADEIRSQIEKLGYTIEDSRFGPKLNRKK